MREMSNEDIQKKLEEDGRTSVEYLYDWIADLGEDSDELIGVYHLRRAIEAFREKREMAERNKGCEFCNFQQKIKAESGYYGGINSDNPCLGVINNIEPSIETIIDGQSTYFDIKFCPMCGKRLDGSHGKG